MLMREDADTTGATNEFIGCRCNSGLIPWNTTIHQLDASNGVTPECGPKPDIGGEEPRDEPQPGCTKFIPGCRTCFSKDFSNEEIDTIINDGYVPPIGSNTGNLPAGTVTLSDKCSVCNESLILNYYGFCEKAGPEVTPT